MLNHSDKLDHLIALAAMKCIDDEAAALQEIDTSDVHFDKAYYRKKRKIIRKYQHVQDAKPFKLVAARLIAAVLLTIGLIALLIGCVPGWKEAIYDAIVGWYEQYFTVRYETPSGQERETETESAGEIVVPKVIEETRCPTGLPEEVWEDVVINNNTKVAIDYYIGEKYVFSFSQYLLKPHDKYVDSEDVVVTYVYINGNCATVVDYVSKKEINILWSDGEYSYHIFSTQCDIETLLEYANSVK